MLTIDLLRPLFRTAWGPDTRDPAETEPWHVGNPSRGQCGVTALVVQDLLGGDLILAEVNEDGERTGVHYWNRLPGGVEVDLTADQFHPGERLSAGQVQRRPPGPPRRCREQYELLRDRVQFGLFTGLISDNDWIGYVLRTTRDANLPDAWVGGGVLRDLVWGELHGQGFDPAHVHDVDVAFFDPGDLSRANDDRATTLLGSRAPHVRWQARNQAAVHTWYSSRFGGEPVEAFASIAQAVATYPETATAVAVRLRCDDTIESCAPLGLGDLVQGVWRRNPRRVSLQLSRERLERHQPETRWPGVTVIPPA